MEDTFYNTELKQNNNKKTQQKSERKKKQTNTWPPWNKSSTLRRERDTAEHRWGWCPFCAVCVSVLSSFWIAAVWAGAAGAAAAWLGGAAAAEPGRAPRGSRARFLCGKEGSKVVTSKELNSTEKVCRWLLLSTASFMASFCLDSLLTHWLCQLEQCPAQGTAGFSNAAGGHESLGPALEHCSALHRAPMQGPNFHGHQQLWSAPGKVAQSAQAAVLTACCDSGQGGSSSICPGITFHPIFHTTALWGGFFNPTVEKNHLFNMLWYWFTVILYEQPCRDEQSSTSCSEVWITSKTGPVYHQEEFPTGQGPEQTPKSSSGAQQ